MISIRDTLRSAAEERYIKNYSHGPQHVYEIGTKEQIINHIKRRIKKLFNHRYDKLGHYEIRVTKEQLRKQKELKLYPKNYGRRGTPIRINIHRWLIWSRNNKINKDPRKYEHIPGVIADLVIYEEYEFNKEIPLSEHDKEELYKSMGKFGIPEENNLNQIINGETAMEMESWMMMAIVLPC